VRPHGRVLGLQPGEQRCIQRPIGRLSLLEAARDRDLFTVQIRLQVKGDLGAGRRQMSGHLVRGPPLARAHHLRRDVLASIQERFRLTAAFDHFHTSQAKAGILGCQSSRLHLAVANRTGWFVGADDNANIGCGEIDGAHRGREDPIVEQAATGAEHHGKRH
jgi:hypothetical protein